MPPADIITVHTSIDHVALRSLVKDVVREILAPLLQGIADAAPPPAPVVPLPGMSTMYDPVNAPLPVAVRPRGRPKKAASPGPKKAATLTLAPAEPLTEIVNVVKTKPEGASGEEIRAALGWGKSMYSYHMRRAVNDKLVKQKGQKRATRYFPNDGKIEQYEAAANAANGIAAHTE